jgi:hypothetical protein
MNTESPDRDYDLSALIIKPLYFGLFINILIPMALLLICYYIETHDSPHNRLGFDATNYFYVFAVLAIIQAGGALWYRAKLMARPMIRSMANAEADIKEQLFKRLRLIFMIVAAISLWGVVFYFISGRFESGLLFVVFSFIVFQFIRPRYGSVQKLIDRQVAMANRGELLRST